MYVQTTLKCNMACAHCCFSCGPHRKEKVMSKWTFQNALKAAGGGYVTLGGGEPTTWHLLTWAIETALADKWVEGVHVITNGKKTRVVERLIGMQEIYHPRFTLGLSVDEFHESISLHILNWFKSHKMTHGSEFLYDKLKYQGRAKEFIEKTDGSEYCICDDMFVKPNGDVFQCGCPDAKKLGNVNFGQLLEYEQSECGSPKSKEAEDALKAKMTAVPALSGDLAGLQV